MAISLRLLAHLLISVTAVHALATRDAAGDTACQNLTASMSTSKVISDQLSADYISSRLDYWNARQSKHAPACVVYPTSTEDVSAAIQAIRAADSTFAIKSQGHNSNDLFSSVDGGVLIDLQKMNAKMYNEATTLASYEPGSNWGELYSFYQDFGRTVMGGRLSGVGTGLALGGGMSYLSPQYGMACDSFREIEVVLPSGEIVIASNDTNPDLFMGLQGGGGNQYGIVTKYTVQSRPIGNFYAGNIIWVFDDGEEVLEAIYNFAAYNTDPKAAILPTFEKILTPDLNLNLDSVVVLFLVYDGEDPGNVFDNFTSIPHIINTLAVQNYTDVANLPFPFLAELTRADNRLYSGVHRLDDSYKAAYKAWDDWTEDNKGKYVHTGFYLYPVSRSWTDASKAQGGGAAQLPDGPWFWTAYDVVTLPGTSDADYDAVQESFKCMVESTPNAPDLPMFLNEASKDQNPLATFSTYSQLQQIKQKYDPDSFFASKTGGWSFA